ncbi:hypothetical protein LTR59_004573 [Friedmanniomyces endolithicus]|nr:hypothetical protein LTR94_004947 [Friedmanniomyces endolithicus]KAK0803786.1 hypothetical protein LTR59_004573 [Friedmanniomyces endolithicus]KAK0810095.1 hypothetical protein LTR38_004050 [Friedmanniomyces endolithicus]
MRLNRALAAGLAALCCVESVSGLQTLGKRQGSANTSSRIDSSSTQSSSAARPTSEASPSQSSTTDGSGISNAQSSTTTQSSATTNASTTSSGVAIQSTEASTALQSSITSANLVTSTTAGTDPLPITPTITPALGIAGCILIVTGAALCLIGIKHQWLYIFLSTALLASVAVTVLIIYVMNPPVRNAIQGAYMVAAVVTGLIFGALALVFKEVTDGLGCLLGGFCLSMWFLVLSPGGLILSTTGKAIMIAVFCLVFFALSFSQYTRSYGLILGTSFAGAQVTVIGVDCFSRAGLKEFWMYIWGLNQDAFPINTTTYPITRGMKVEIACTVILFLFGLMSQFKIWKVVKERRARKNVNRFQEGTDKDQLEEAVGRDIEASNQRDREVWEAEYGNKNDVRVYGDSGVGSSVETFPQKRSVSIREREIGGHEMAELAGPASAPLRRSSGLNATEIGVQDVPTQSEEHLLDRSIVSPSASRTSPNKTDRQPTEEVAHSTRSSLQQPRTPDGPAVVPLPFWIPLEGDASSTHDQSHSVVSRGTAGQQINRGRGMPLKQHLLGHAQNDECFEDDRASSVAATADGDVEDEELSAPRASKTRSPYIFGSENDDLLRPSEDERDRSPSPVRPAIDDPLEEDDDEAVIRPSTALEEVKERTTTARQKRKSTGSSRQRSLDRLPAQAARSEDEDENVSLVGSLKGHLPQRFSKVAMTYRTNEWAKHITDADKPAPEEEAESHSPGIQVDHAFTEEAARPVDVEALMPTSAQPARALSQNYSKNPYHRSTQGSVDALSRANNSAATPVYAFQRSSSAMSINAQNSNSNTNRQPRLSLRKTSMPLMSQPLVESPIEDALAESKPYRDLPTPMSMSNTNNLMGERRQRVERAPTSTSFHALTSTPHLDVIAPSESASIRDLDLDAADADNISLSDRKQLLEEENMTLAERKARIHANSSHEGRWFNPAGDRSRSRQSSLPTPGDPAHQGKLIYDHHPPKRSSTVNNTKQVNMLTNWRQSLQQDTSARQPLIEEEGARQAMMSERRKAEHEQQRQQAKRASRESVMDSAMRSRQFHGAHRDAMRRLQAKANQQTA